MQNIKLTLKAARVNRGLTQKETAKKLGISESTLFNYEKGKTLPNSEIIYRMSKLYDINYNYLVFPPKNTN